jgi:hypothetical protein
VVYGRSSTDRPGPYWVRPSFENDHC